MSDLQHKMSGVDNDFDGFESPNEEKRKKSRKKQGCFTKCTDKMMAKMEESRRGKLLLISEKNKLYHFFCLIVTISCLISSYIYAYMAAFRLHPDRETKFTTIAALFFELIFVGHMCTQFILEYTPEGSKIPVRDYKMIAMRYMKEGDFAIDLVAIIPF